MSVITDRNIMFQEMAEPAFFIRAFAEYTADKQRLYSEFIALYSTACSLDEPLNEINVDEFILNNSDNFNPQCYIPFQEGFIRMRDLFIQATSGIDMISRPEDEPSFSISFGDFNPEPELWVKSEVQKFIQLVDGLGNKVAQLSIADVGEELQSMLHSVVCLAGACFAMELDNISERLSYFRDYISRTFNNAYTLASNAGSFFTNLLEKARDALTFMQNVKESMGVDDAADDNSPFVNGNSQVGLYTGASPLGPLDFGSAVNIATSTIKTGAKVVANVIGGILGLGAKVIGSAVSKVISVATNPDDMYIVDNKQLSFTTDGWQIQSAMPSPEVYFINISEPDFVGVIAGKEKLGINTLFGEILFQNVDAEYGINKQDKGFVKFKGEFCYRLKPLNWDLIKSIIQPYVPSSGGSMTIGNMLSILTTLRSNYPGIYVDANDTEVNILRGLRASYILWSHFAMHANIIATTSSGEPDTNDLGMSKVAWDGIVNNVESIIGSVTNAMFVTALSGYNFSTSAFPIWNGPLPGSYNPPVGHGPQNEICLIGVYHLGAYCQNRVERKVYPLSYHFYPFTSDYTKFSLPRFAIKTDQENYEAWNKLATTMIVVAVVAVVAIGAIVKIKRLARNANWKAMGLQRDIENNLAKGIPPTKSQMRQLRRNKLKAKLLGYPVSSLQGSLTPETNQCQDYSEVTSLIV